MKRDSKATFNVNTISIVASIILIAVAFGALYLHDGSESPPTEPDPTAIEWRISTVNDTWRIEIMDIEPIAPANVSVAIIGPTDCLPKIDDPSGFPVPLMGDLDDMVFNGSSYNDSNVTFGEYFHSRDLDGLRNMNITLFMVFVDVDGDGLLSSGDEIWIRTGGQAGPCTSNGKIKMVNNEVDGAYGSLPLPDL